MKRTAFLASVHKLAEQLGRKLFALVERQSERARAQALAAAKTQLCAELEGTHAEDEAQAGPDAVEAKRASRATDRAALSDVDGRRGERARDRAARGEPDHADRAGDRQGSPRAAGKRGPQRCSKCKQVGHNAKTCASRDSIDEEDDEDEAEEVTTRAPTQSPPPTSKSDRFAAIEAAAASRRAVAARTAARMDTRARPARGVPRVVRTDAEPEVQLTPGLPTPIATFEV